MADETVSLHSPLLSAEVAPLGAELVRLRDREGRDLLWHGDAAFWAGRAPLLFPIVGRLPQDELVHEGRAYPMKQHGFARRSRFEVIEQTARQAVFRLLPNEETRAQYPFGFALDVTYALTDATLDITARVHNPGDASLPASFGFHPAFLWPLPYGGARADHRLVFEQPETGPAQRLADGLLSPATEPNPAASGILAPDDALFARDALILPQVRSRRVRYGVPGHPGLEIGFTGMPQLGLWSKPGAPFLCIEPWHGHATPQGHPPAFAEKPGLAHIPPGGAQSFAMSIRWLDRMDAGTAAPPG